AQTIERNGMGIPLYKDAEGATPDAHASGLAMAKAWRSGEAAGSAIPFGADLTLVGVSGTLPDAEPAVRYHDEQIGRAVLAHFLNLGTQTGSWALGTTFADFFTMSLQTLAEQVADVATQHVVEDLVDVNWGTDEPAPKIVFDEIGSRQAATAAAIKSLVDAGILQPDEVLEESTRQQYGLPPKDPDSTRSGDAGAAGQMAPPPDTPWVAAAGGVDPKGPAAAGTSDADGYGEEIERIQVTASCAVIAHRGGAVTIRGSSGEVLAAPDADEAWAWADMVEAAVDEGEESSEDGLVVLEEPTGDVSARWADGEGITLDPDEADVFVEALRDMAEFAAESGEPVAAANWNPSLHPRGSHGRFRTVI